MRFSYSDVWADTAAMLKANLAVLIAIAGVFFLLPTLLIEYFAPQPVGATTVPAMIAQASEYYREHSGWLLLANLVNMVGTIAIYLLLLGPRGVTVGNALAAAVPILPFYFLLSLMSGVMLSFAFLALIVPCLYLLGRVAVAGPLMVAEARRNPFDALRAAFARSRGAGWRVAGLVIVVAAVGFLLVFVVSAVLGSVLLLAGGREGIGGMLALILGAGLSAGLSTVLFVLLCAIYRALAAPDMRRSGT